MKLLALSDLHIENEHDPLLRSTLEWIDSSCSSGDVLVLAGDIFDLYVGHKPHFRERFRDFHAALVALAARGVELHYIEGNHDFRLKRAFPEVPSLQIHERQVEIQLGRYRVYVAHGDLVDREDHGYLALRAALRSFPMRTFIDHAPDTWVERVGERMSGGSQRLQSERRSDPEREKTRQERTRKIFRSFAAEKVQAGFDFVILGHCHLLDDYTFQCGERTGRYMNMGFPRVHASGIVIDSESNEMFRLPLK